MGLQGFIRSANATVKRIERENRRRQREYEKLIKAQEKLIEIERARLEVDQYENYIELIQTMHVDVTNEINWTDIKNTPKPLQPDMKSENEDIANKVLKNYKPGILDKLFKRVEKKRSELQLQVDKAIAMDKEIFDKKIIKYNDEKKDWEETIKLANEIINGVESAYFTAINELDSFEEMEQLGSKLQISYINKDYLKIRFKVHEKEIVPKEIKSLLKSGKLTIKNMPQGKFNEIYQDYVCSSILRIAREMFGLLPVKQLIINAYGDYLNSKTGYIEEGCVLSVFIPRETLSRINFENIDPSDSMDNFVCNMKFKKSSGLEPVEELNENMQLNSK